MSIKEKYGLTDEGVRNVKLGAAVDGGVQPRRVRAAWASSSLRWAQFVATISRRARRCPTSCPTPSGSPRSSSPVRHRVLRVLLPVRRHLQGERPPAHRPGRAAAQAAAVVLRAARPGGPHRDHHGRRGDHRACVQPRAARAVRRLHHLGVAAVGLLAFDWRLAIAALWSAPVALALLFASRRFLAPVMRATRMKGLAVSEDIQEALECVREVRATNQEERYLDGIRADIDAAETPDRQKRAVPRASA